jgi:DNA polymerase-4
MILHLDLDSFFASVHRRDDPTLQNRPIAVGGRSNLKIFDRVKRGIRLYDQNSGAFVNPVFYHKQKESFESFFVDQIEGKRKIRGIITTASYEARAFGVKTGMSIAQALKLCPNLRVLIPNYLLYHEISHKLYLFLQQEIPLVEQYSIDEFFGDVRGWIDDDEVLSFANELKSKIKKEFDLPISIGISEGKWIAKLATNYAKPNGICLIPKGEIYHFIKDIKVEQFPGIAKGYKKRLEGYFVSTLGEALQRKELFYSWGKSGKVLYHRIKGDEREGISIKQSRKSVGVSRTFDPIKSRDEIRRRVVILARHITFIVLKLNINPTTYYLKINYDFQGKAKGRRTIDRIFNEKLCKEIFLDIFRSIDHNYGHIVKISLSVSNFSTIYKKTLSLVDHPDDLKEQKLSKSIQKMRSKYSLDVIKSASEI